MSIKANTNIKPTLKPYYEYYRSSAILDFIHWPILAILLAFWAVKIATMIPSDSISKTEAITNKTSIAAIGSAEFPRIPISLLEFRQHLKSKRSFLNEIVAIEKKLLSQLQSETSFFTINVLKNGSILIKFARDYFPLGESQLTESMMTALNYFVPKLYAQLYADEKLKSAIQKVTLYGFSSPFSESEDTNGQKKYNQKLALSRARSIFNYIFNIEKMKFQEQDFAVKITTISGQGTVALARLVTPARKNELLKKFCLTNDCYQTRYIMLEPQLNMKKVARSTP